VFVCDSSNQEKVPPEAVVEEINSGRRQLREKISQFSKKPKRSRTEKPLLLAKIFPPERETEGEGGGPEIEIKLQSPSFLSLCFSQI